DGNEFVEGIFLCFPDIPSLNYRGTTRKNLQDMLSDKIQAGDIICNQWFLMSTEDSQYIVYAMKQKNAYCGCWMDTGNVLKAMGLANAEDQSGEIYFADIFGENSLKDKTLHDLIGQNEEYTKALRSGNTKYNNYVVEDGSHSLYMGLVIPEGSLFGQMPLMHRIVFLLAFLGLASTIALVLWLNTRISRPIFQIKDAMERYGNGDVEYRLEERNGKTADEFDLLGHSLNEMMDKVNELEYNLYETRLKEQETQLKYISQQIRPHFILNALNVIYTYKEE
ncbi:MAG: HAMP domain-containing protein, partial [Blautia sp.]|nr:HAMP domain-containing protein [Blautia sp.]